MDSSAWRALVRLIPPTHIDNLILMTTNKTEFAIQGIVRDVDDFLVIRGRLMGQAEVGGGFFFIPFDQIEYVGFARPVKEDEVRAMFPSEERIALAHVYATAPEPAPMAPPAAMRESAPGPETEPQEEVPAAPGAPPVTAAEPAKPKSGEKPLGAAKAALLERLRARRAALDPTKQK